MLQYKCFKKKTINDLIYILRIFFKKKEKKA